MVAISLYRGNLHRVPDVPRRWLMPNPKISLKNFKFLLQRRSTALSRLRSNTSSSCGPIKTEHSEPPIENCQKEHGEGTSKNEDSTREGKELRESDAVKLADASDAKSEAPDKAPDTATDDGNLQVANLETTNKVEILDAKGKRKREIEEKLQVLNSKKHNLVLVLKQILNVEEELKRRNGTPGVGIHPSGAPLGGATNESGSMDRLVASRMISEANLSCDMEGGEADQNVHSRHMLRMSSTSPSSESPLRRASNGVPHATRATSLGTAGSPSRFAPTVHQGNPSNLPSVSVSGTNYIMSSPSPAASGGTSVFRENRLPSPWN
ncbi:hypothetical protein HS088_TW20G00479 [Tripterygium wilfordii]|uniref:Uncharacterized protein n=1 Tax=Tripterygium wilfordii TaxID=458696 RepID=A0A7J7C7K0_TRIWF|nr:uncharacterized protein LOC119987290 [Tripterygium wilfordii]KAF5730109.1 hypothetical protein HS088_TW20G00479 [Tripterygium wilfordii]